MREWIYPGAIVVLLGIGTAVLTLGLGAVPDRDTQHSKQSTASPTATTAVTAGSSGEPFALAVDEIEECGRTCRSVTVTLTNNGDTPALDVVVTTRVLAANEELWRQQRHVSQIAAGSSVTRTQQIQLQSTSVLPVVQNNGNVTIETTVTTAETQHVVRQRINVFDDHASSDGS